jgi:pimeloyl-ACP methyl ester carboxylesterase
VRFSRPLIVLACLSFACNSSPRDDDSASATATTTGSTGGSSFGSSSTGGTDEPTTGSGTTGDPSGTMSSTTDVPTTDSSGTTGGPAMSEDEILLRQAIAGEVDAGEAMRTIADRGGHPVATAAGGFLFACLCGPGEWTLAGDHNEWVPDAMGQQGPLWWIEADVPAPDGSLYKFHEPAGMQYIADPLGRRHGYDQFGRFSLVRASAAHLERWYAVDGSAHGLGPRDIDVLVPDGGAFTRALYAHDGQNLFDPEAIWGGWHLLDTAPPDTLIVGIHNTPERIVEYTHVVDEIDNTPIGGKAAQYAALLDEVIRPRMEAEYGAVDITGTMGSSLGGLVSLVIADLYPASWDMVICMSGTLGWGSIGVDAETILDRYEKAGKREFAIYLDSGGHGPCADNDMDGLMDDDPNSADNYCENVQMRDLLQQMGYMADVDLFYAHDQDAPHNEAAWAARVDVPLQIFAGL